MGQVLVCGGPRASAHQNKAKQSKQTNQFTKLDTSAHQNKANQSRQINQFTRLNESTHQKQSKQINQPVKLNKSTHQINRISLLFSLIDLPNRPSQMNQLYRPLTYLSINSIIHLPSPLLLSCQLIIPQKKNKDNLFSLDSPKNKNSSFSPFISVLTPFNSRKFL